MPREYRTIQEVAGPLMLVRGVEKDSFNELAEIELAKDLKIPVKYFDEDMVEA